MKKLCRFRTSDAMQEYHVNMFFAIRMISALASVVLYIIAYFLVRHHALKVNHQLQGKALRVFEQRQLQLTTTMCISCFVTITFYIIPACAVFFTDSINESKTDGFIKWYAIISSDMNSVVNAIVIYVKQEDIACAMRKTLKTLISIRSSQHS
ncbi:hypothetical protein Tcan_03894 [Toxocara canis]|uniref:G-protein coupled receptors family 1 profile domain-containing protein n=1 Tax=Toxocara canis TaxID=6265 RepID=A0A0B2UTX0_TOXCA|nr:hypothetical protein Tcan_03894 [Toxocara canis]